MESQSLSKELMEAVQSHPFFQGVEMGSALSHFQECEVRHYQKGEIIFRKDTERHGLILVLEGIAEVYVENSNAQSEVLEILQKGELIGFSCLADFLGVPWVSKDEEQVEVRAVEDLHSLFIPFKVIARRWEEPYVRDFLLTQVAIRLRDIYGSLAEQVKLARDYGENEAFITRVQDLMTTRVIAVPSSTSVLEGAQRMSKERTSSILVMDDGELIGIVTERDIVTRVVASGVPFSQSVRTVMTRDPHTISRWAYYYEAISFMLLEGIKHLPVVEDGKVVGIVTLSDLFRKKNENVMQTIKQISEADVDSLANVKMAIYTVRDRLLAENIPIIKTLEVVTELYDRLVARIVGLAVKNLEQQGKKKVASFAFYQMGSGGRGEQFMLTDQDHFLVYHSGDPSYFQELGSEITALMEAAGYERCKGLMMCSEKEWRGQLSEWEERLRTWSLHSTNQNLLLAQNFFSYRFITGDEELHERFEVMVMKLVERSRIFLYRLAQLEREHSIQTLDQPIRSLFRLKRKSLDMKKSVLFPYHHSLQILSLLHGIPSGTPFEKIEHLLEKGVFSQNFATDLKEAAGQILGLYVKQRMQQVKKGEVIGSVIQFSWLSSREKDELILSLRTLKDLQSQMLNHFSI